MSNDSAPSTAANTDTVENRFLTINRDRLRRVQEILTPRQRDFLEILPLLFHTNHPSLPGYVSRETPAGISDYAPTQRTLRAVKRICRAVDYDRRPLPKFPLQGLYIMGSPGTIAYSRTSDLDLWLCHDPDLDEDALGMLAAKARRVEKFAADLDLEVHFFVFDVDRFRRGEPLVLSNESSGSSQHFLLLDEFYRSSVLVAGLKPLWWRVPSERETEYEAYSREAIEAKRINPREYIDFGALPDIPVEEFFGAAVWQLYKSIDSPYKSVMKLLLTEAYADEYPDITLLSARYKQNVEQGDLELVKADPYILMYAKVEEYLLGRNDHVRLEVMRRSFYLKTNIRLSDSATDEDWRGEILSEMIAAWGWTPEETARLDARNSWRIDTATEERRDLINTLKDSYAALSLFARKHAEDRKITENDLHALGRKLYAAFEKKPAKIEAVTRGICIDPTEPNLSLHEVLLETGQHVWMIFAGVVKVAERSRSKPMKRSASVAEILVWCHVNGMIGSHSLWHLFCDGSNLSTAEIKRFLAALDTGLVRAGESDSETQDLGTRPRLTRVMMFANLGLNPFSRSNLGGVLTSDHTDAFHFGGRRINLVHSIDLVFSTSWNETFSFHYEGPKALLEALAECAQWIPEHGREAALPRIRAQCFVSDHSNQIAHRVERTANEALSFLLSNADRYLPQYIIEIEDRLHRLRFENGSAQVDTLNGHSALISALGDTSGERCNKLRFDAGCRRTGLLPDIFRQKRQGHIQIFAHRRTGRADVYMIDERGVLLVQNQECFQISALLQHYRRFLEAAMPRCHATGTDDSSLKDIVIDTVEIVQTEKGLVFKPHFDDLASTSGYLSLQVLADADSEGHQQFTIYCNHREFSTWEHGGSLFVAVAQYVRSRRESGATYPIYITDLDLSTRFRSQVGVDSLRPYDLLKFKKRIEHQLTRALSSESAGDKPVALAS